jgi:hypothetical protein
LDALPVSYFCIAIEKTYVAILSWQNAKRNPSAAIRPELSHFFYAKRYCESRETVYNDPVVRNEQEETKMKELISL